MTEHACELALADLHDNPMQPRFVMNEDVLCGIATAIVDNGNRLPVAMALTVRPRAAGGFEIIAGHHRAAMARELGLATVWAHVQLLDDRQAALALATTNNQASMTAYEHAKHALQLAELYGVTLADYGRMVGRSEGSISKSIAAYQVLCEHGGPSGPNAAVSIDALAGLAKILDAEKRAALLFQFRHRRSTREHAEKVFQHLRAGVSMREAFNLAEGHAPAGSAKQIGAYAAPGAAGSAAALAAASQNAELIAGYEWTLALFQARCEELETRLAPMLGADLDVFTNAVAARQRRILRELRVDPKSHLVIPPSESSACASCEHGRASAFSDTGWVCAVERASKCMPLTHRRFWVAKEDA